MPQGARKNRAKKAPSQNGKTDKYREKRRLEAVEELEEKIEQLEENLQRIEKDLLDASTHSDHVQLAKLGSEHKKVTQILKKYYCEWKNMMGPVD
jgi:uncharacterized protein YaaN involved in tellurite resistance